MRKALAAFFLIAAPSYALATNLDVTTEYRLRGVNYTNLNYNLDDAANKQSFLSQSARLGFALKDILLTDVRGETETLDIVLKLRAVGATSMVKGSTVSAPFDRIAAHYPSTDFTPFFENAYLHTHNLVGWPWDLKIGRQSYRLGGGLLLDDDGIGLTGISARFRLPWGGIKTEGFVFQAERRGAAISPARLEPTNLDLFGLVIELPTEGTWQLIQLIEKDRTTQYVAPKGCQTISVNGCLVSKSTRWFSGIRYRIAYGPLVFDGEAAMQKGAATPTGPNAIHNHVTYNGNAQLIRAKWKQTFYTSKLTGRKVRGIARVSMARGTGDNSSTATTDEAFFPTHGHRFDGLERAGFGELFGATPYDAFGGNSTGTASGLAQGASGVVAFGVGITPPAYRGIIADFDYYIYQAEENVGPDKNLGTELNIRFRYDIRDRFQLRLSAAYFRAGSVTDLTKGKAQRYMFEAVGRF